MAVTPIIAQIRGKKNKEEHIQRMYKQISIHGYKPTQLEKCNRYDILNHEKEIIEDLADKLTLYLNFCIKEKTRLLYN